MDSDDDGEGPCVEKDIASFRGRAAKIGDIRVGRFSTGHVTRPVFVGGDESSIGNEGPRTRDLIRRQWGAGNPFLARTWGIRRG